MKFYGTEYGTIKYHNSASKERLEQIADITHYERGALTTEKADLQPGDILTYYGHTNVYIGKDDNGVKMWYDAGRGATKDCADGSKFTHFKKTTNNIGIDVSNVIRLKFGTNLSSESGNNEDNEAKSYAGAIGMTIREFWASMCAMFDKSNQNNKSTTVLYTFKNLDNTTGFGMGNGDIVKACEEVTKMLLNRHCKYSLSMNELISADIDRQLKTGKYFCCATYVSAVLYYAGVLKANQINSYAYHWTGAGGVPSMLQAAGWRKVPASQVQPGDVVNHNTVHVMIYAGNGRVWDQTSAVVSSSGNPPTGKTTTYDLSVCEIWRAPGK